MPGESAQCYAAYLPVGSFNPRPALMPGESEEDYADANPRKRVSIHARH